MRRKPLLGTRNDASLWSGTDSAEKAVACAEPLDLTDVKAVAHAEGATVNDVLIACVAGTLRSYLAAHDTHCSSVTFLVPVNLTPIDLTLPTDLGNSRRSRLRSSPRPGPRDHHRRIRPRVRRPASAGGIRERHTPFVVTRQVLRSQGAGEADCAPVNDSAFDLDEHQRRRDDLLAVVRDLGLVQFDEPRELASGELSCDFIDAKRALAKGRHLRVACQVIVESIELLGIDYDAVGGLTLGADQFSHGIATHLADDCEWFVVRKKPKGRGTDQMVEGAQLGPGSTVLLVDDIVTTGGSIQQAYEKVTATGATVVAAVTLVDRGEVARAFFEALDVPYAPVFTYRDLGIKPVGG